MRSRTIAAGAGALALVLAGGGQALASDVVLAPPATGDAVPASVSGSGTVDVGVRTPLLSAAGSLGIETTTRTASGHKGARTEPSAGSVTRAQADPAAGSVFRIGAVPASAKTRRTLDEASGTRHAGERTGARGIVTAKAASATRRSGHARNRNHAAPADTGRGTPGVSGPAEGSVPSHGKTLSPLRSLGREVGNPLQLQLAAWLLALVGGACLVAARLASRGRRHN
jgi:hypothetical protein